MKIFKILTVLMILFQQSQAQTFAEWFKQKSTQKKYLIEQIAALQVYIGFAKDGYNIAHKGLNAIGDIKNGDFNLHSLYFSGLKAVNPEVARYPRVRDILDIQQAILQTTNKAKRQAGASGMFGAAERTYIQSVYDRLAADCTRTLNDLDAVTTPGKLEMKDDERLKRIDALYTDSQGQYRFAKTFSEQLAVTAWQKKQADIDDQTALYLYGIKN